ncbi:MAG: hypothetical protein CVV27_07750 [Candidatus Melainabacteria bacterium HGW-Melainabacteria-1]|nr:MAG: hypothetical protein CVV27_07750 [Candidatus Melainabacteria bacterium HGW-Melainabacteria-1]
MQAADKIPDSDILSLWQAADQAQAEAQERYPAMACRSGCNDCCKHHGSPMTYAREWELIVNWLAERPELLGRIQARFNALKISLQTRLGEPKVPSLSEALFEVPCPCIETVAGRELCGIYPVRPLTCRTFGNTLLVSPADSQDAIYTCNPEKARWEQELPMLSELALPQRSEFFAQLEQQDQRRSLLSFLERWLKQRPLA